MMMMVFDRGGRLAHRVARFWSFRSCATRKRCLRLFSSPGALAVAAAVKSLCDVML